MPTKRGFSLVELMIVLAIMVTLAAIALPNLQRSFQRNELRDAGRLLQETLGEFRHEAMQSGRPLYVQIGWESNTLRVLQEASLAKASELETAAVGGEPRDGSSQEWETREIQLATDVRFQPRVGRMGLAPDVPTQASADQSESSIASAVSWSKPLVILPDGSVEEVQFWLELDRRWQCPVLWRGATGQLEIGSVQTIKDETEQPEYRESL